MSLRSKLVKGQANHIGDEQEQSTAGGGELARAEREMSEVGNRLDTGTRIVGTFLIAASRQGSKALLLQDLTYGSWAERMILFFEGLTDLIDGEILFA
jgi:phosphatidylglycerophosphate synthase